jgi:hypothetical protein
MRNAFFAACSLIVCSACGSNETELEPVPMPTATEVEQVVPFARPPAGVRTQSSNNNLDVIEHDGRTFLAFRTAPTHFASTKTEMFIVSSEDQETWTLEAKFAMGTDLREPRFLAHDGALRLYFAVLGKDVLDFTPEGMMTSVYERPGKWSDPVAAYEKGFIPWRAKVVDGKAYLIGYVGGENIYDIDAEPIRIHFLTTENGIDFRPVVDGKPVIHEGGGSETDFVFQDDGSLVAVIRNEAGEDETWGSLVCRAEAGDLGSWTCEPDKKKYDSPCLFRSGEDIYLIGRRNLTDSGNFDLDRDELSPHDQSQAYLFAYSFEPKRCAVWKVDPDALTVSFVLDLPSKGDTCFASVLPREEGAFTVYNYTNELEDETNDPDWIVGQGQPTIIYKALLTLP